MEILWPEENEQKCLGKTNSYTLDIQQQESKKMSLCFNVDSHVDRDPVTVECQRWFKLKTQREKGDVTPLVDLFTPTSAVQPSLNPLTPETTHTFIYKYIYSVHLK